MAWSLAEGTHQAPRSCRVAAQGGDHPCPLLRSKRLDRLGCGEAEDRVRAELEQCAAGAAGQKAAQGGLEEHRLAQVAIPVLRAQLGGVEEPAGDGGVEGNLGAAGGGRREGLEQLVSHRLDLGRVGGVVDGDALGADAVSPAEREQVLESVGIAGGDQRGGAVDRRQRDPPAVGLEQRLQLGGRQRDRDHRALTGDPSHRLTTTGDDAGGVLESSAPAMWAAAISPWECPSTAAGRTPRDSQRRARETITAKRAGWTMSRRSSQAPFGSASTSRRDQSRKGSSASSQASIPLRKAGESASSSTAMPACWAPWPGKRKTVRRRPRRRSPRQSPRPLRPLPGHRGRRAAPRGQRRPTPRAAAAAPGSLPGRS